MKRPGDADLTVRTRAALLDALQALEDQIDALIVIGAQAVYFHTGEVDVAIPEETKDADVGVNPNVLRDDPLVEEAITAAGFFKDLENPQPGSWLNRDGIPVDLLVPEAMAGPGAKYRRGARVPPHDKGAMRHARGLEAMVVDNAPAEIGSLDHERDPRRFTVAVAGPGALLVAKMHKLGERAQAGGDRMRNKDAHDVYRLLVAIETEELAETISNLLADPVSAGVTGEALEYLFELFATADSIGATMAGRAEAGVGEPETVAASVSALAVDLVAAVRRPV